MDCATHTLQQLQAQQQDLADIVGIAVTTFGVDGAPFDRNGKQLYPHHFLEMSAYLTVNENLSHYLNVEQLYQRNGIGQYSFNTLFKLLWLKENKPEFTKRCINGCLFLRY